MNHSEQLQNISDQDFKATVSNEEPKEAKPQLPLETRHITLSAKSKSSDTEGVTLIEDEFAQYYDENGVQYTVKRFTWRNKNRIQIQVLNYGARVISIKLPDRKGEIEDVLLGFDDLAGYIFYEKFYFGSIIGRTSNVVKNSTFVIDNRKYTVSSNDGKHHVNGGIKGLDKVVWDTYVVGKKVIMSHVSPHLSEGYPGDLLVRATFELSPKNEFKVNFEAETTRPTCVDLSHLLYFNLAGHHMGPEEIYRHILTMNCNCFTPQNEKIPTGEIYNVLYSDFDFQVPKLLGKVIGLVPKDGFDQNLCVNRAIFQNECFVARLLHPPSGRMLEIYSNQPGVQLNTANCFGYGILSAFEDTKSQINPKTTGINNGIDSSMQLFEKVYSQVVDILKLDEQQNFNAIKQLISKFSHLKSKDQESLIKLTERGLNITSMQYEYLKRAQEIVCENQETDDQCLDLKQILSTILHIVQVTDVPKLKQEEVSKTSMISKQHLLTNSSSSPKITESSRSAINQQSPELLTQNRESKKLSNTKQIKPINIRFTNKIPVYYKDSKQIRGKGRALYKAHGAISLQTQNYPNAVNIKQFPNCILNPGEVYKHDIVYRFWIRAGNPSKWIRRNLNETKQRS